MEADILHQKTSESSFCISPDSLRRDAPNFFTAAFFGYFSESETTSIFIERDPDNFAMIVQYLRRYDVDWPLDDQIAMNNLIDDVKYYGFERLLRLLEQAYEERWPQKVIPWQIRTYAPETEPIVAINLKNIEIDRWDQENLIYNVSPVIEVKESGTDSGHASEDEDETNGTDSKGIKFESFTFKDLSDETTFRKLTAQFRSSDSSLTFSPSLKLPFLKDACIVIDGREYCDYNDLSAYFGVTTRGKPLYFEEAVIRIDNGAFLIRARAWTYSNYYVKQPFIDACVV
ncbi:2458_t:CDS:2 [Paraglomus occultum]|uniref:2458_t:CDS:1 n=1 Tax=Paraglomus occultum TaxID=144539 RepID=A0A9N9F8N5_9GLOM|nr:2458_t:CDS:2 [Paraglomus occultum]